MGALALLGAEPREPTKREQGLFRRGKDIGRYVVEGLIEKYGPDDVVPEMPLAWPAGIAHPDAFVRSEALTVEAKSRRALDVRDADLMQLGGYMRWNDASEWGALVLVDPSDYQDRWVPVLLTDELAARVDDVAAQVVKAGKGGPLPPCVCDSPSACRNNFCPFTDEAWQDWTPPPLETVNGPVPRLAAELYAADLACQNSKGQLEEAERRRREVRAALLDAGIEPGRDYLAGDYRLKVTREEKPRTHIKAAEAVRVGVLDAEKLVPFTVSEDAPRDHWSIKQLATTPRTAAQAEDFGDEAPF